MTNLLLLGFLPSGSEWIIIALVILLLFGGKKIPELIDRKSTRLNSSHRT